MKLYTQGAIAKELNVALKTVWRWCKDQKLQTTIFTIVQANGKEIQYPYISEPDYKEFVSKRG